MEVNRKFANEAILEEKPFDQAEVDAVVALLQSIGLMDANGRFASSAPEENPKTGLRDAATLDAGSSIDDVLSTIPADASLKLKCKALLLREFATFDIIQKLRCSEGLLSAARKALILDAAAGLISALPRSVTHASSEAKRGRPRPDVAEKLTIKHANARNKRWAEHAPKRKHREGAW